MLITSIRNPRISAARKLRQRKHRREQGRFLVEGRQLHYMALERGITPREVFYCPDHAPPDLLNRLYASGADCVAVAPEVLASLASRDGRPGLVSAFATFHTPLSALPLSGGELVLVLDRLQDPGNVGTLVRAADAVGAAAVVLLEPCSDPFDPRAVRASMGSLFHVPLVRAADPGAACCWLRERGLRVIGADVHSGITWGHGLWPGGVALVLGNEGRGLADDVRAYLDGCASLPVIGGAESLNVAVAGGVLMYAWLAANSEMTG